MLTQRQTGFTLLEILTGLVLLGLLTQMVSAHLMGQYQTQAYQTTEQHLNTIEQGLLTFFARYQYLPCPDTNGNGEENRKANGSCQAHQGKLPYLTLDNLPYRDGYDQPFLYAINTNATQTTLRRACTAASLFAKQGDVINTWYQCSDTQLRYCLASQCNAACTGICTPQDETRTQPPYFDLLTPPLGTSTALNGNLRICLQQAALCQNNTPLSLHLANQIPIVILSFGQNAQATWQHCDNAHAIEQQNCDLDRYFIAGQQPPLDDQLRWISPHQLKPLLRQP